MKIATLNTIEKMLNDRDIKIKELREENKKLKSDLAFERTMLDNVKAEYKSQVEINKKLKEKQKILDKENCELIDENVELKKENEELKKYICEWFIN